MLTYLRTSLFKSDAQTLVNPVNCVGVMGKGLAADFRKRYPEMFSRYRELCENQLLDIGKLWLWKSGSQWVLNFPTKRHWRSSSRLDFVELGLHKFVSSFEERGITEVAFPRLGCGNGGLDWSNVRPLMESYLKPLPIPVYIHDYDVDLGVPEHFEILDFQKGRSFPGFWSDIRLVLSSGPEFSTFINRARFSAEANADELKIYRGDGKRITFSKEDMFEIWNALSKGIMTRQKLTGRAYDEAYYLFPILSRLPYIEPMQAEKTGGTAAIGLKLVARSQAVTEQLAN